jgi:hypothetical protein
LESLNYNTDGMEQLFCLQFAFKNPKAKCPFVPQREMVKKLWGTDEDPLAFKSDWEARLSNVSRQHFPKT